MNGTPLGLTHLRAPGDAVSHSVAIILILASTASWYIILGKLFSQLRGRHTITRAIQSFSRGDRNTRYERIPKSCLRRRSPASPE